MAATIFLDPDDEITAVVGRLRVLEDREAVLVIGPGSRIGTSRINFKLLAREAQQSGLSVVAVSAEPTVRALAVSAGVPAYDSVASGERALVEFRRQDEQLARRAGRLHIEAVGPVRSPPDAPPTAVFRSARGSSAAAARSESTRVSPPPLRPSAERAPGPAVEPDAASPVARRERRRRRVPVAALLGLAVLGLLLGGGLYAAYVYLPTATITLRPSLQPVGPLEVTVTADPGVGVVDAEAGVVPAERIEIPLSASGSYPATGTEITRVPATGTVRFTSENTLFDVPVPAGTVVATDDGVEFETTTSVVVPRASFETGPTSATAPIEAREPGPAGNVAEEAITRVPRDLASALISVTNPRPTSGGARDEQQVVTDADYDTAVAALNALLADQLDLRLADPSTAPSGLTLFPESVDTPEPEASPPAEEVVGTSADSFGLTLTTSPTVLAVNEALVEELALERLRASVPAGQTLVGAEVVVRGDGVASGSTVTYTTTVSGQAYTEPDREALLDEVRGRPLSEARATLERHGTVDITVWPEFVDRLPEQAARISLTVVAPSESP